MVSTETVLAPSWRAETLNKGHGWVTLFLKVSYLLRGGNSAPSKLTELNIDIGSVKTLGQESDINFSSNHQVLEKVLSFSQDHCGQIEMCQLETDIRFRAISWCWIKWIKHLLTAATFSYFWWRKFYCCGSRSGHPGAEERAAGGRGARAGRWRAPPFPPPGGSS